MSARPLARRPVLERRLGSDGVLIDAAGKAAYLLNATAWAIWELCDGRRSADEVVAELARRYGVSPTVAAPGCQRVLGRLQAAELVTDEGRLVTDEGRLVTDGRPVAEGRLVTEGRR